MTDVYAVHTARPNEIGAVEVILPTEAEARAYALDRSQDDRILSASVTRFEVGKLGTRRAVAWYVQGAEQPARFDRPCLYPTDRPSRGRPL